MKIVKISFENINNLKGPQEVDFSAEPLASAGLFAIIGPTGSGKSTLLDVITLALFNRVPRFKGSLSKNSITDMGAIMTHHTTNAAASIEYKIHNHHYTSKWEISTARTGNLRDYHMEIMDEQSGSIITDKKTEVPSKNESIIGLNYDQFVKSIILAQGDFSKFLQATKNERGQLLENITGASIYRTIGQAAFQKHKEAKLEITAKQNILENTKVLTEEARSQIIQDIASAEEQKSVLDLEIKRLADILHIKKTLQEIDEGIVQKDKLRTSIIADINAFTPQLKRLQLHDKINPLRGDVSLYVNAKENAQTHRNQLAKHQKELKEISQALAKVLDDMSSLTSEEVSSSNFRVVMTSFEKEVNKLDADLAHISSKGIDQRQRITDKIKASTLSLANKTEPHDALDLLDQSSTALKAFITSAQIDESSNIDTLKEKLRADRSNLALLKEYAHARDHVHDASKKIEDAENKLKQLATDLEKNKPLLEKSQALLRAYQENNASLNKRKEDALKIASLEKLRPTLQDGEPCPLCGSVSHPYTTHLPDHGGDVIDDEIAKNQKLIDQETTAEKKLTNTITSISTSEKLSKEQLIEATQQHKQASIKLKDVEDKISDDKYKTAEKIGTHLDALEHTIGNLEKGIEALQQLNINQELTKEFTNLKNITAEYQLLAKTRKEKSSVKDVSAKCNALQDQFNQYTTRKQGTTKAIEIESSSLDKAQNDVQTLATKLTPHLQKNGFKSVEDINSALLEDTERQKLQHTYDELTTSHTAVETELKNLHSAKKKNSALDSQPTLPIIDVEKNIKKNCQSNQINCGTTFLLN